MSTKIKTVYHCHKDVSVSVILRLLKDIPSGSGFFLKTFELPEYHPGLMSGLFGPVAGDKPVPEEEVEYKVRKGREIPSRIVRRAPRRTRKITIIGLMGSGRKVELFTAFGGEATEREPWDASLTGKSKEENTKLLEQSRLFWREHALCEESVLKKSPGELGRARSLTGAFLLSFFLRAKTSMCLILADPYPLKISLVPLTGFGSARIRLYNERRS